MSTSILHDLPKLSALAVAQYWQTRSVQFERQAKSRNADQGLRSAVTGGAQMDGFIDLLTEIIINAGLSEQYVFRKRSLELLGYFRPTKEWDILVVRDKMLLAAIEVKSQVGPSFGNNFNNRTEEAMGSALDLWTAYREHAYLNSPQPFLGYFFMLEECEASSRPVKVKEPHFKIFPEFEGASYQRRYELFCRKLVLERHYTAAAFITSSENEGLNGGFHEPADDLSLESFAKILMGHIGTFL